MIENTKFRKIHIIGGAGSGKTTLAKWIAEEFKYPNYDLDQIGWNENGKVKHCRTSKDIGQLREMLLAFKR